MTITIFVEPESFKPLVATLSILKDLDIDNDYVFTPTDLNFSEAMISNWYWLNLDIAEYFKLKYCMAKLSKK